MIRYEKVQKYKIQYQHVLLHVLAGGEWQGDSVTYDPIQPFTARETPPVPTLTRTIKYKIQDTNTKYMIYTIKATIQQPKIYMHAV